MGYIGNIPALDYISYAVQNFTVTAGTTSYSLDYSVSNENDIRLVINNVIQRPGASYAYSATGTTLTLTSATNAGDTMYAVFIGRAVQTVTPPANSITNTMLAPSVITGQTAETSVAGGDLVLIYDDSASALRKMTKSNLFSGIANTPAFHAYNTSNQTVTSDVQTKVTLSTELFDTDNCFDSTTNYRFTPTTAGKYFIYGHIYPDGSSYPNDWSVQIRKNGTSIASSQRDSSANNVYGSIEISSIIEFNGSTDYVELFGKVRQAGTTFFTGGQGNTFFGGYKIIGA